MWRRGSGDFDGGDNEAQRWTTASSWSTRRTVAAAVTDSDDDLMDQGIVSVFVGAGRPRRRRRIMSGLKFIGCPLGCCGKLLFHSCPPCSAYIRIDTLSPFVLIGGVPLSS